jgi:hypothetical protein
MARTSEPDRAGGSHRVSRNKRGVHTLVVLLPRASRTRQEAYGVGYAELRLLTEPAR